MEDEGNGFLLTESQWVLFSLEEKHVSIKYYVAQLYLVVDGCLCSKPLV